MYKLCTKKDVKKRNYRTDPSSLYLDLWDSISGTKIGGDWTGGMQDSMQIDCQCLD